jgi:amidohydrolase
VTEAAGRIAATYGVEVTVRWHEGTPGADVHPEAAALLGQAIREVAGEEALRDEIVTTGADDFHYYAARRPGLRSAMLAVGVGLTPGLHVPSVTYDTAPLPTAAGILARAVTLAAGRPAGAS